ncbi:hypothetical protein Fot_41828 [Forsythia ovata]|uniref:Uncharacterized protein n=1 Tax=Forsythia ovata TaxID=205694 RepID=A0ABD1RK59_9LAMI
MTSQRSNSKCRRQSKKRRKNSASKRSRGRTKAFLKPEKKKFSIHVPEGENTANLAVEPNMEPMQMDLASGTKSAASFDHKVNSLGEAIDHQNNLSKSDDHTVTNVQSSRKVSKKSGHTPRMEIKLGESGTKYETFQEDDQSLNEGNRKKQKISSRSRDCNDELDNQTISQTSLNLLDDDIIFSEENLRHIDESAEKNCVQFQKVSSRVHFELRTNLD